MKEIEVLIDEAITDDIITKVEKEELKAEFKDYLKSDHDANVLRSKIFDLAFNKSTPENHHVVLGWLEQMNKLIVNASKREDTGNKEDIFFSPGEECLKAIITRIKYAQIKISCCVFTISDNRISEALIAAHKKGVSVKIISDNDKMFDKGSDISLLSDAGIKVKIDLTDNHMHHKFAIFDGKHTLTGSYNWTRSAERYNHENILITDSEKVTKAFTKKFDKLWDEMAWLE